MKLLLDSQPLIIIPELAELIGLNESIVLQQVHYWLEINRKADRNFYDGHHWTYNSYTNWQEQFPFWSIDTIKRTFTRLQSLNLLIIGNFNKAPYDRTKWYRIDYKHLAELHQASLVQNAPMDECNMHPPIPETTRSTFPPEHELGILTAIGECHKKRRWRN